jgi:hypothetical protein
MQPEHRDYLEEYIRALQGVKLRHFLCLQNDEYLIVKGGMGSLQWLQCAESRTSSWTCERQLTGKPTFRFSLATSGVDPKRPLTPG